MGRTGKFIVNKVEKSIICDQNQQVVLNRKTSLNNNNKLQLTRTQKFELILTIFNRLIIGFVTIYMLWMCLRLDFEEIPWHAVLCTLGFVCLMSEGILAHYRGNAWTQLCYRPEKTRTHWILQLCGSIIGLIGIGIKLFLEDVHFHTVHGMLGLATLVLLLLSLISGFSSLYAKELKDHMQPLINKTFHNVIGLLTFVLAMLSMYYSYETDIFIEHSLDAENYLDFRILLKIMIILILILSSYGPLWCLIYSKLWKSC